LVTKLASERAERLATAGSYLDREFLAEKKRLEEIKIKIKLRKDARQRSWLLLFSFVTMTQILRRSLILGKWKRRNLKMADKAARAIQRRWREFKKQEQQKVFMRAGAEILVRHLKVK
jgi:hypothetical protein